MNRLEQDILFEEIAKILAGISKSKLFWDVQQCMRGERILLSFLFENGGSSTPGNLAALLGVSAARITKIISSLESKDLIARADDPEDKRRVTVRLTANGAQVVADVHKQVRDHAAQLFFQLGEDDTLEFLRLVKKLLSYEEMIEPAAAK